MTNQTETTLDQLIFDTFVMINDDVYCTLLDLDVNPGRAYEVAYIDIPTDIDFIRPDFVVDTNTLMDHDDLIFADQ